jgi:hypothetical protein
MLILRQVAAVVVLACAVCGAEAQPVEGGFKRDYLDPLLSGSCPQGARLREPDAIDIRAAQVPLQMVNPMRTTIGELSFVGGFHLTSKDKRFGGLSGLDLLDDGRLLAASDAGDFVWIALDDEGTTPVSASIAGMSDRDGQSLRGKARGDAEGLAVMDGMALVSFEGDHRVLAFGVGQCGADARGVPVALEAGGLPAAMARQSINAGGNGGVEALAVAPGWFMMAGVESKAGDASAVSVRALEAAPEFDIRIGEGAPGVVGLDLIPNAVGDGGFTAYSLHRSTRALASEVIVLVETRFERGLDPSNLPARITREMDERSRVRFRPVASRKLAAMNPLVTMDNFEGVAARRMPDGRVRLYIVSDDNFSASQRTLLMIFEVADPG